MVKTGRGDILKNKTMCTQEGGDRDMVEETIRVIRETEAEADAKIKDAETQCQELLAEAKAKAQSFRTQQREALKQQSETAMEHAVQDGEEVQRKALADIEQEVKSLKETALSKEDEAVGLVISQLI